jgi:hypothetical protein
MCSFGPCLQNGLSNNVAEVNGRGREFGTQSRYSGVEKELKCTMDDLAVILSIQALINAKIASKWVIRSHSHSDFASNIK